MSLLFEGDLHAVEVDVDDRLALLHEGLGLLEVGNLVSKSKTQHWVDKTNI